MMPFNPWVPCCNECFQPCVSMLAVHDVPAYVAEYVSAMSRLCRIGFAASACPSLRMTDTLFDVAAAGVQIMYIHVNRMHGAWAQTYAPVPRR
jgi:hypothetical protein